MFSDLLLVDNKLEQKRLVIYPIIIIHIHKDIQNYILFRYLP